MVRCPHCHRNFVHSRRDGRCPGCRKPIKRTEASPGHRVESGLTDLSSPGWPSPAPSDPAPSGGGGSFGGGGSSGSWGDSGGSSGGDGGGAEAER
jgi:uncharacterized membrane protein YgcG